MFSLIEKRREQVDEVLKLLTMIAILEFDLRILYTWWNAVKLLLVNEFLISTGIFHFRYGVAIYVKSRPPRLIM